ncbi:hypothetical protein B0H11DRAFT_980266 [Mycena galericulata]|nr:hypothetical protein B0H11DRAFT_980266 [Mycena galericulata]
MRCSPAPPRRPRVHQPMHARPRAHQRTPQIRMLIQPPLLPPKLELALVLPFMWGRYPANPNTICVLAPPRHSLQEVVRRHPREDALVCAVHDQEGVLGVRREHVGRLRLRTPEVVRQRRSVRRSRKWRVVGWRGSRERRQKWGYLGRRASRTSAARASARCAYVSGKAVTSKVPRVIEIKKPLQLRHQLRLCLRPPSQQPAPTHTTRANS